MCKSQKCLERLYNWYSLFAVTHLRSVSWDSVRRLCRAMSSIRCYSSRNRQPDSRPVHCPERAWCMPPWRWHIPWGPSGVSSLWAQWAQKTHSKNTLARKCKDHSIIYCDSNSFHSLLFCFELKSFSRSCQIRLLRTHTHTRSVHCKKN